MDRRGRFLYLVVFVLYYVQITVNAGYNEPLIEVLFLMVPALLVLNTERYGAQVPLWVPPDTFVRVGTAAVAMTTASVRKEKA